MLAIKNPGRSLALLLAAGLGFLLAGCTPPGPRALLQGDAALASGDLTEAVEKLKRAVELLPEEPRAWNLLGVAYHQSGQVQLAAQAYRQALVKDRSNLVAVAHYNLGALLLEQGSAAAAVDELRSYTFTTNSLPALLKLGTAQIRARQWEAAERTFNQVRLSEPKNVQALNGLGVARAMRSQRDAAQYFQVALQLSPQFGPALLNQAVLAQQVPSTRTLALQRYRDYLALPESTNQAEVVKSLIRQLEAELAPRPLTPVHPVVVTNLPKTNPVVTIPAATNPLVATAASASTNLSKARVAGPPSNAMIGTIVAKTNPPPIVAVARPTPVILVSNPPPVVTNARPSVPVEVVKVTNPPLPAVIPPAETLPPPAVVSNRTEAVTVTPVEPVPPAPAPINKPAEEKKPGFLARLNPFRSGSKPTNLNAGPRVIVLNTQAVSVARAVRPQFPRYQRTSPARPGAGDRGLAQTALARAGTAWQAGQITVAQAGYQEAVAADPAWFEAHFYRALLAAQNSNWPVALAESELALVILPESVDARYNFALSLKQAGFPHDAEEEFLKLLEGKPEEVRAHLAAGNLYAQQLQEFSKARKHYLRVLELEPKHPQAGAIRFWLGSNP